VLEQHGIPTVVMGTKEFESLATLEARNRGLAELPLALGCELLIFGVGRVAAELRLGLREKRLVAQQVCFRLCQRRLERTPIQSEELLPLFDGIAFAERQFRELTGDLRTH